jgi:carboxylesterase
MNSKEKFIYNAHLDGSDFLLESGNTAVMLIHGFTATTSEVRPLAKILFEKGFTVAGPLLPGHYTKPEDLNNIIWQDWINTVDNLYKELKHTYNQVIVGGESMGGLLALYLASLYHEIKAVLTYAPALRLNLNWFQKWQVRLLAKLNMSIHKEDLGEDELWQGYYSYPLRGTTQLLNLQNEVRTRLHQIHQPILIIQGRLDPTVHSDVPDMIYNAVCSDLKEVIWMENSQHCVIIDKEMDQVAQYTLEFLSRVLNN